MIKEFINVIKQGVVIKQFDGEMFSLNTTGAQVTIHNKIDRKIRYVLSPHAYDYVEIETEELP